MQFMVNSGGWRPVFSGETETETLINPPSVQNSTSAIPYALGVLMGLGQVAWCLGSIIESHEISVLSGIGLSSGVYLSGFGVWSWVAMRRFHFRCAEMEGVVTGGECKNREIVDDLCVSYNGLLSFEKQLLESVNEQGVEVDRPLNAADIRSVGIILDKVVNKLYHISDRLNQLRGKIESKLMNYDQGIDRLATILQTLVREQSKLSRLHEDLFSQAFEIIGQLRN